MVRRCVAYNCKETAKNNKERDITFHSFPKDPGLKIQWISAMRRKGFTPSSWSYLCCKHFKDDCFEIKIGGASERVLKKDAIPTIFNFSELKSYSMHDKRVKRMISPTNFENSEDHLNREEIRIETTVPIVPTREIPLLNLKNSETNMITLEEIKLQNNVIPIVPTIDLHHCLVKREISYSENLEEHSRIDTEEIKIETDMSIEPTIEFNYCEVKREISPTNFENAQEYLNIEDIKIETETDIPIAPTTGLSDCHLIGDRISSNTEANWNADGIRIETDLPIASSDLITEDSNGSSTCTASEIDYIQCTCNNPLKENAKRKKVFGTPRYVGDCSIDDAKSLTTFKHCWRVAMSTINKQKKKIKALQQWKRRSQSKIRKLERYILQMRQKVICPKM